MSQKSKHLILNSDIRTWKFDRDVVFLGKWCLQRANKTVWEKMKAEISPPLGNSKEDIEHLFREAREIEANLFPHLSLILNDYHKVEFDERYWKILTGHWLRQIIEMLTNRINSIKRCYEIFEIQSVTLLEIDKDSLAGTTYLDSILKAEDNSWNDYIYLQIIKKIIKKEIKIDFVSEKISRNALPSEDEKRIKVPLKQKIYLGARTIASRFIRSTDALIINSYLPLNREFILEILLGQFPQWHIPHKIETSLDANHNLRKQLGDNLSAKCENPVEKVVASLIFELMPKSYLEAYSEIRDISRKQIWPKNPKFIFTSNNFAGDEIFKTWVAEKVIEGKKYFVGQHGSNYGTNKYFSPTIEEETADKFLTWGWRHNNLKYEPGFVFKNATLEKYKSKPTGELLVVQVTHSLRINIWEQAHKFDEYLDDQIKFLENLRKEIKYSSRVRLHPSYRNVYDEIEFKFREHDQKLEIDFGDNPIRESWKNSRLVVHCYDSTGMLETLSANIPTLAFWSDTLAHLSDNSLPFYKKLIDAGILHESPVSISEKINEVWDEVNKWWDSPKVQSARIAFCHEYARSSKKPARDLRNILLKLYKS